MTTNPLLFFFLELDKRERKKADSISVKWGTRAQALASSKLINFNSIKRTEVETWLGQEYHTRFLNDMQF